MSEPVDQETEAELLRRIGAREASVAVVGLGYVGLPLALRFVAERFAVTGVERDRERLSELSEGRCSITGVDREELEAALAALEL